MKNDESYTAPHLGRFLFALALLPFVMLIGIPIAAINGWVIRPIRRAFDPSIPR